MDRYRILELSIGSPYVDNVGTISASVLVMVLRYCGPGFCLGVSVNDGACRKPSLRSQLVVKRESYTYILCGRLRELAIDQTPRPA